MLLRRHKINSVREGKPNNIVEDTQQEELYGEELNYKAKDEEAESKDEKPYTKTDINKMSKAELLEMAINTGVEGAEDMSRAELVEYLLSVFGL